MQTRPSQAANAGFTLIEILAVMMILAILGVFLIRSGAGAVSSVDIRRTETFLQEIGGLVDDYNNEFSAYPPSTFASDLEHKPSKTNEGIESLVITLWRDGAEWQAREISEEYLGNIDGDSTRKSVTTFSSPSAFELLDVWGNPIAYIHRRDYDKEFTYLTLDPESNDVESRVKGLISSKTGDPYRRMSYQLISAGPDGEFDTDDDLANFEIER
jgi:prepilin-type N-terminal cleavage/methylation domain-containing protein